MQLFCEKNAKKVYFLQKLNINLPKTSLKQFKNMEKVEIINAMFGELKKRGLVEKQRDIADAMNVRTSVVSSAMHGHPNGCTQSFINRLNKAFGSIFNPVWLLTGEGAMILADAVQQGTNSAEGSDAAAINTANQQGDNLGGHAQKNLSADNEKWFALVDEKDRQINRLLSLLEKEQESKSELERKNNKLVDALINQNK